MQKEACNYKILYLSNSILPSKQANGIHVMRMCDALTSFGDIKLRATTRSSSKDIFDFYGTSQQFDIESKIFFGFKGSSIIDAIFLFFKLLFTSRRLNIIYSRDIYGLLIAKILGFNSFYEIHAVPTSILPKLIEKLVLNRINGIVFISKALANDYQALNILKNTPFIIAHDGAKLHTTLQNDLNFIKSKKGLDIGYTGHLYQGRGIDIILDIAKSCGDDRFHIIGGDQKDIDLWSSRATENIVFHGFVTPNRLPLYFEFLDILLMPYQKSVRVADGQSDTSRWMSPMKLFEYMAAKRAIVSSDLPVLREILSEDNAILVKPDSVKDWVDAIDRLRDKNLREKLASNAYNCLVANYTWNKRAQNIANFVRDKVENRNT